MLAIVKNIMYAQPMEIGFAENSPDEKKLQLKEFLNKHDIDTEGKVIRETNVVIFDVVANDPETGERYRLREAEQVFADGSIRVREYQGVSEKIKRDESPEEATVRGLMEGLNLNNGYKIADEIKFEETRMRSTSYPGLESKQKVYRTNVIMDQHIFKETKETGFEEKQFDENGNWIKTTTFVWEAIK